MAATPEKTCLPQGKGPKADYSELRPAKDQSEACPNPDCNQDLLQQFTQLQERFQRTTNALASAAHDLKTPLAIMNGYVELLQSEKLGAQIGPALRSISDTMRTTRRLRAEEAAAKTTVKILFPLVLFILPAMMSVIVGPAMIQIMRALTHVQ